MASLRMFGWGTVTAPLPGIITRATMVEEVCRDDDLPSVLVLYNLLNTDQWSGETWPHKQRTHAQSKLAKEAGGGPSVTKVILC